MTLSLALVESVVVLAWLISAVVAAAFAAVAALVALAFAAYNNFGFGNSKLGLWKWLDFSTNIGMNKGNLGHFWMGKMLKCWNKYSKTSQLTASKVTNLAKWRLAFRVLIPCKWRKWPHKTSQMTILIVTWKWQFSQMTSPKISHFQGFNVQTIAKRW